MSLFIDYDAEQTESFHPRIRLSNGITIANFSSPHSFRFVTGEVLPACPEDVARRLLLKSVERHSRAVRGSNEWTDIELRFEMSGIVRSTLILLAQEPIDVILVPLPVLQCLRETQSHSSRLADQLTVARSKARACRVADRVTKEIFSDRFCR